MPPRGIACGRPRTSRGRRGPGRRGPRAAVDERVANPASDTPRRARNALIPLAVLVLGTMIGMGWQGYSAIADDPAAMALPLGEWLRLLLANAQSDVALLYASGCAWVTALLLTASQRLLSWRQLITTSLLSTRALYMAFGILFLAWTLGHICRDLGTSFFLTATAREAMTAAATGLLTIYDMCKAMDRGMEIGEVRLMSKTGGKSGAWSREGAASGESAATAAMGGGAR